MSAPRESVEDIVDARLASWLNAIAARLDLFRHTTPNTEINGVGLADVMRESVEELRAIARLLQRSEL